jgi:hypothetical protein
MGSYLPNERIRNTGKTGLRMVNLMTTANIRLRGPITWHDTSIASFDRSRVRETGLRNECKSIFCYCQAWMLERMGLPLRSSLVAGMYACYNRDKEQLDIWFSL